MSLGDFDIDLEGVPARERVAFERELLRLTTAGRIENLLEELGLSQSTLAQRLRKSRAWVSKALSGRQNLTLDSLAEIGVALGIRFSAEMVAAPRASTPAAADAPLPAWVHREERNRLEWSAIAGSAPPSGHEVVTASFVRRTYFSMTAWPLPWDLDLQASNRITVADGRPIWATLSGLELEENTVTLFGGLRRLQLEEVAG